MVTDEAQEYLDRIVRQRGYVLDFHKIMAAEDLQFLRAYNSLLEAAYINNQVLDSKTKELLYIAVLTALGSTPEHIEAHMRSAVRAGATKEEVLAVLELLLPAAGVPRFMVGCRVWEEVFSPQRLEPSETSTPPEG